MYRHNALPYKINNNNKKRANLRINKYMIESPDSIQNKELFTCKNQYTSKPQYFVSSKLKVHRSQSNSLHKLSSKQKPKSIKSPDRKENTLNSTMMRSTVQKVNIEQSETGSRFFRIEDMIKYQKRIRQITEFNQTAIEETHEQIQNDLQDFQELKIRYIKNQLTNPFACINLNSQFFQDLTQVFQKQLWESYEGETDHIGNKHGYGKLNLLNGSKYQGFFNKNVIDGHGSIYYKQNLLSMGIWKNNRLIEQILHNDFN